MVNGNFSKSVPILYSVPQGSQNGPYLYLTYASALVDVIDNLIQIYGFADDHALRKYFASCTDGEINTKHDLELCLVNVKNWMMRID